MPKQLSCRDLDQDCDAVFTAETEEEILQQGGWHAVQDHGWQESDITPDLIARARSLIRES